MNTNDDFAAKYEDYKEQLRKANLANKTTVFDALQAAKVTSVQVDFDGEGDSGQIDGITASQDSTIVELPSAPLTIHHVQFGTADPSTASQPLREAIEALCYDCLESYRNLHFRVAVKSPWLQGEVGGCPFPSERGGRGGLG
jgi:hypothetical protein